MKTCKTISLLFVFAILATACQQATEETETAQVAISVENTPAEGFNFAESDPKAMAIADEVMEAMGGRAAWDNTRHICWTFFGRRALIWDKWTGNVRIDDGTTTYLVNINDETGSVYEGGEALAVSQDSLKTRMRQAKSIWINDSYWMVMPFKLKDSGVTLKYVGEDTTQAGEPADKLQLTFQGVGRTPQNKYFVWVDKTTRLVSQWAYYPTADAEEPRFVNPWKNYQTYGIIKLSDDREMAKMEDIMVFDELPESVYTTPEKPDLAALKMQ